MVLLRIGNAVAAWRGALCLTACLVAFPYTKARAAQPADPPAVTAASPRDQSPTYADLADLADSAPLVIRAQVRATARVEDARAPGRREGVARFYIEARTVALLTGSAIGGDLRFLADLPLDARGKPVRLKKRDVLIFANPVAGRPGEIALVTADALYLWEPAIDARLRTILTALVAPDAPLRIVGVREIMYVPGNLAGEGETQVFLATADGSAASLTIAHRPGERPRWGASFSELTADVANPPLPDTLAWYRLACFLPRALPAQVAASDVSATAADRAQAKADYAMVLDQLGACARHRAAS